MVKLTSNAALTCERSNELSFFVKEEELLGAED
jgi:hypothetical protein